MFLIKSTSDRKDFKMMENIDISEAMGIYKPSSRFLKDGAEVLAKTLTTPWNISKCLQNFEAKTSLKKD